MSRDFGTVAPSTVLYGKFTANDSSGGRVDPSDAFEVATDFFIYKDGSAVERTSMSGVTITSTFDTKTGLIHYTIDLSDNTDASFYASGSYYSLVLYPDTETVDSQSVAAVIAEWYIGYPEVNVVQVSGDSGAADNLELDYDGTGYNKSNSTIGTTTTNTDMRGTDSANTTTPPTAAAIRTEIDSNSTQLAAIVTDTGTTLDGKIDAIDTVVDAILVDTGTTLDGKVNTIDTVVDSILAMLDDARTEPGQGAPPVNPDLATKIDYLYKAWRNKKTQTSSETKVFADDGTTIDHKASISDDGTTTTVDEMGTGA